MTKPSDISSSHKPELDKFTPSMIRVLAEYLLYTMQIEQRNKLKSELPELYNRIYSD